MSLLVLLFRKAKPPAPRKHFAFSAFTARQSATRRRYTIAVLLLVSIIAIPGLLKLKTDIQITHMLPEKSYTRRMATDFEQIYEGRNFLQLTIESNVSNGACRHDLLTYVMNLQTYAEGLPKVTATYSFASVMAMANQVWNNWEDGTYTIPSPMMLVLFTSLLKAQEFPFTHVLADDDWSACHLYVRTVDMPSSQYLDLVNNLRDYANKAIPAGTEVTIAPGLHSFLQADRIIRTAQMKSGLFALLSVTIVLFILWRSLRLALLAAALTGIPILLTLGFAGYAGIPLNAVTFTVAAIVAGIAVDDIVHFITYWQQLTRDGEHNAIEKTLQAKGSPIIFTSILLVGLFAAFTTSSFPPAVDFGLLAAIAFALTLTAVLLFLPQLLKRRSNPDD